MGMLIPCGGGTDGSRAIIEPPCRGSGTDGTAGSGQVGTEMCLEGGTSGDRVILRGDGQHSWGQRCDAARGQVLHQGTRKWHCSQAGGTSGDREVTLLEGRW